MFVYLMMMDSQEDQSKFEKVYLTYRGLMRSWSGGLYGKVNPSISPNHFAEILSWF